MPIKNNGGVYGHVGGDVDPLRLRTAPGPHVRPTIHGTAPPTPYPILGPEGERISPGCQRVRPCRQTRPRLPRVQILLGPPRRPRLRRALLGRAGQVVTGHEVPPVNSERPGSRA